MLRFVVVVACLLLVEIEALRRRHCSSTGFLFPDQIVRSSVVLYGESLAKAISVDNDRELLFNVTFRVDCVLKGDNVEHRIDIVHAGIQAERTACQWLDPGRLYIVFLEKCGSMVNTYCALDFPERVVDEMTYDLLEKTCHLSPVLPRSSTSDQCPNVSLAEYCPLKKLDMDMTPRRKYPRNGAVEKVVVFKSSIRNDPRNAAGSLRFSSMGVLFVVLSRAMSI